MSKLVKNMITNELKSRWDGVTDALLVDVASLEANDTVALRRQLREKNIHLLVVKNSLARRAAEGTTLSPAFDGTAGTTAVVWGAEDIVSLAKEVTKLSSNKEFEKFTAKGGVMDGTKISPEEVKQVSKWPSRTEQLSILMGQILSPGATLSGQMLAGGANLASQIKQISEKEDAAE
ncbi:50S ribosomal protein L10 [Aeoliella mucimassa]|uniref:Large ribosomal subunit protein uL10 n=1 Tax=Aeoliella mucimassa TaxID=2527972 RepID=A0A518ATW8_9BACT|nr:50S ribosomal protein L10 [Aeoliella mucimassa]QDU58169.1 50S ribosomal protein L10 [Aeoliella mucimassa]